MERKFTIRIGGVGNRWFLVMGGRLMRMRLKTKCSFLLPKATAALHLTAEAMDAQANPGTETTWTPTPTTSPELIETLDLKKAYLVGHSTGGGEVARYIGRHGTNRVAKAVLIGAVPPLMLKTPANPGGLPIEAFNQLRDAVIADRAQFFKDLSMQFYGYNRPDAQISEGVRENFWHQGMMAGFPAAYFCIKAFSETDFTEDLKKFDVPTLILHGDDDQIVPFADSAALSAKIIKNATLKVYKGAPHGMCTTLKNQVNADLLAFFKM